MINNRLIIPNDLFVKKKQQQQKKTGFKEILSICCFHLLTWSILDPSNTLKFGERVVNETFFVELQDEIGHRGVDAATVFEKPVAVGVGVDPVGVQVGDEVGNEAGKECVEDEQLEKYGQLLFALPRHRTHLCSQYLPKPN